ncbi:hypothetical protein [Rhizobium sp. 1399]|uniref:hypothetical protein n=1 Tax=Rhizobium sp. 1399 TaxID=2817758 RepID=UPI0028603BAE|nr:hypothetical protein [Rhizobium sp. 1399]MDR6667082.1 hypothetical protein [Rhizobium sp. 1399]
MTRYLWTLDRKDQETRSGLSTENELIAVFNKEDLPCVMPADWLLATMKMDIDGSGLAIHESLHDPKTPWKLQLKPVA